MCDPDMTPEQWEAEMERLRRERATCMKDISDLEQQQPKKQEELGKQKELKEEFEARQKQLEDLLEKLEDAKARYMETF